MSFASAIAEDIRKIPELAKGTVAFAGTLASVEGMLVAVESTTHAIPSLWMQALAAGVSLVTGAGVVLTDLAANGSILHKAVVVAEEVDKVVADVQKDLHPAAPAVVPQINKAPSITINSVPNKGVAQQISEALQPVIADATTVVTDVTASAAADVVDQVVRDFQGKSAHPPVSH